MRPSLRSWVPLGVLAYTTLLAVQSGASWRAVGLALLAALTGSFVIGWVLRRDRGRVKEGGAEGRAALEVAGWGAGLWLVARAGDTSSAGLDVAANLGTAAAAISALFALARIPAEPGILRPSPAARSLDAAIFTGFLWGVALAVPGARALLPDLVSVDPLTIDYATTIAGTGSLLLLLVAGGRAFWLRRLELGVADRTAAALVFVITALGVGLAGAMVDVAAPDRLVPLAVVLASLGCAMAATVAEPTRLATWMRGTLALFLLAAPVFGVTWATSQFFPGRPGLSLLVGLALAAAAGLLARNVARPLGPVQSRWLEAIAAASHAALEPDPESALRASLSALQGISRRPGERAGLWRMSPPQAMHLDVAGYLHVEPGELPERLVEIALGEPARTLRAEVLRAVQVRRPDTRPLLAWLEARQAFCVTVVVDRDGPLGALLLPTGARSSPLTLEEARALAGLADRVSVLIGISSALERSRGRELEARATVERLEAERERLLSLVDGHASRHRSHAERLGWPVLSSAYGPACRLALADIERLARGEALGLAVPDGVPADAWVAVAHLSSGRTGPLLLVDGTAAIERDLTRWNGPASPFTLCAGGTLGLLDAAGLPPEVQDQVAQFLESPTLVASQLAPPLVIVIGSPAKAAEAGPNEAGQLEAIGPASGLRGLTRALARQLEARVVVVPALVARGEDLRALIQEILVREGLRQRGMPLGIEPRALRLLMDDPWPGNEAELEHVLRLAVRDSQGDVLMAAALERSGYRPRENEALLTPLPTQEFGRVRGRRPS